MEEGSFESVPESFFVAFPIYIKHRRECLAVAVMPSADGGSRLCLRYAGPVYAGATFSVSSYRDHPAGAGRRPGTRLSGESPCEDVSCVWELWTSRV